MQVRRCPVPAAVLLGAVVPALAAAQVPAGGEFRVNASTTPAAVISSVATDARGDFVVVWQQGSGNGDTRIMGRRFDVAGVPSGSEFQVSQAISDYNERPVVTRAARGSFEVAWTYRFSPAGFREIRSRGFDAAGLPLGPSFIVASPFTADHRMAADPAGNFVVVWTGQYAQGDDILARRFAASGAWLGDAFRVNTYTPENQRTPSIAMDHGGNFVVVWHGTTPFGVDLGIYLQHFDASGARLGGEYRVNTYTTLPASEPHVARSAGGDFVVVWTRFDGHGTGLGGQMFDASGSPAGAVFTVNTYTTGVTFGSAVATDEAGNFVVAWSNYGQDGSIYGVFAQRFTASGAARGAEFRVNSSTGGPQVVNALASDAVGNFVVTWSGFGASDGSSTNVFAQRFGGLTPSALAVDTGRNGIFEPGEVVDVVPSWRNVNGAPQTIGGTAVSFSGPQPAVYQVNTPSANYATIPNGEARACLDCYRVAVPTTARPVLHWDAVFDERLTPDAQGQEKLWRVHLGASFADVALASSFYPFIEVLLHHGITGGCNGPEYCPGTSASREQMAVFVLLAKEGPDYRPPACTTPVFGDVPASSPFCPYIEELARRGVVSGCGGGNYCASAPVSREQMPVFVLRTQDPTLDPPACTTPIFADVPASSPFCRWIEELARRGVVGGCGGGNYCAADPVTREQMAVFLAEGFGLTLYGP